MKMVKLASVAEIAMGTAPPGNTYNETGTGIPMIAGAGDFGQETPKPKKWTTEPTRIAQPGDLIVCVRATIGNLNWADKEYCLGRGVAGIRAKSGKADIRYLARVLEAQKEALARLGTGSTFLALRRGEMENFDIPLPPLDEQKRIAAVLDKTDALRRQRQESLQLTEKLLQSVFIDMFGDLTGGDVREYPFGELALPGRGMFSNGPFGSDLLTSELQDTGVPVVYIRDIRNGEFTWKSNVFVSAEKAATLPSCEVRPNDLLIAKVGDPPGIAALYPEGWIPAVITQDVIRVRVNPEIVQPVFLQHYLNSEAGRHLIQTITVKGTRSRFSLGDLKKLKIPIPQPELQATFADVVAHILELRQSSRVSDESLSVFFSSLQQRAFRGELDLSRLTSFAS